MHPLVCNGIIQKLLQSTVNVEFALKENTNHNVRCHSPVFPSFDWLLRSSEHLQTYFGKLCRDIRSQAQNVTSIQILGTFFTQYPLPFLYCTSASEKPLVLLLWVVEQKKFKSIIHILIPVCRCRFFPRPSLCYIPLSV